MKKIKFIAMIAAMGIGFAACEPTLIDGPEPYAPVDATYLAEGITYQQFADEGCTTPDPNGNFVRFASAAGIVQVFVEGDNSPIYTGAGGVFKIPAKRGQEPKMNMVFRVANADGTFTEATKEFGCTPPTELSPEMLILVSDYGQKVWKWAAESVYGNGGHTGAGENFNAPGAVDGKWWGCESGDALVDQLEHSGDKAYGDESNGAYMVFTEEGKVTTYDPTGKVIRSSKFAIKDYDPTRSNGWDLGKLTTAEPATLFPWKINGGGTPVTEFDIMYFTPQAMTLAHTAGVAAGGWGEITFWSFISGSPDPLTMEGKWTYAPDRPYGEVGYLAGTFTQPGPDFDSNWWSPGSADELAGRVEQSGGVDYGDGSSDAYMIFEGNTVNTYKPDGTKVRGGTWSTEMNDFVLGAGRGTDGWELGKLNVDQPALLYPWHDFSSGEAVTSYDIMYFDANNITLIYAPEGTGEWGNATYWLFTRKTE